MVGNIILGTTKNKLGDVVFSRKKGQTTGRVRSRKIKNPQTDAQAANRARMSPLIATFRALNGVLYSRLKFGRTQYNQFISNNLKELRPTSLGKGISPIYEVSFPFMIPPTPKEGTGGGLPTPMPMMVTKGIYEEPEYGVTFSLSSTLARVGKNIAIYNGIGAAQPATFWFDRTNGNELIKQGLTKLGFSITKGIAGSIVLNARETEKMMNFVINKNNKIHTGFLGCMYNKKGEFIEAKYAEIGNATSGSMTIKWGNTGNINAAEGTIKTKEGDTIAMVKSSVTSLFAITIHGMVTTNGIPTNMDSAVILSQRINGKLQVSTSKIMITIDANDVAYQSLFTQESIDRATKDYQKITKETNETNLSLKVD